MRPILITLFFFLCLLSTTSGQVVFQPKQIDYNNKGILYDFERSYDFKVYTNGISLGMTFGEIQSYYKTSYYSIEIATLKDFRERRQNKNIPFNGLSSSFVYGKQNSIYLLKFGQGKKVYLTEKAKRKGLAVGFNYNYGLTVALKKPYYLQYFSEDFEELITDRLTEENREQFLRWRTIFGGASFFDGFWNIRPTVGAHAKIGAHFAFGAFDDTVRSVEIGLQADAFPRRLPILVERDDIRNRYVYVNIYLMAQFGKRR
jgi:hypothetical protein